MRATAIVAMVALAAFSLAGPVFAKGTTAKVVAIEGDKLTVQVAEGNEINFPVGTRGVSIQSAEGASLRARVVAVSGNKITFRVMRGKASSLAVGVSVELEKAMKAGSEEMQGC